MDLFLSVKLKDFSLFQNYKFSENVLIQNDLEVLIYKRVT